MSEPIHYFARVAIRDKEGRYLVVHNIGPDKVFSPGSPRNRWELPGGKLDPGEEGHQAAIREALEEVGLVIDGVKFIMNVVYTSVAGSVDRAILPGRAALCIRESRPKRATQV